MTTKQPRKRAPKLTTAEFLAWIRGLRIEPFIEIEWHRSRLRVGFRMPLEKTAETAAAFGKIMSNFRVNRKEVMTALLNETPKHAWWNYQTMKAR